MGLELGVSRRAAAADGIISIELTAPTGCAAGWPSEKQHRKRFSAGKSTESGAFTVVAANRDATALIAADELIGGALAAAGMELPVSCEQGICGTRLTDVIDGIPDHRDPFLTDEEKATNRQTTPCCSRACTPVITLAL